MHPDQEVTPEEARLTDDGGFTVPFIDIERRLIEGEDRIEVIGPNGAPVLYEIPRWREHPIRRTRIAWRRWRFRSTSSSS
jgi:hypothetical protein